MSPWSSQVPILVASLYPESAHPAPPRPPPPSPPGLAQAQDPAPQPTHRRRPRPGLDPSPIRPERCTPPAPTHPPDGRPRELIVIYSQHYCTRCRHSFHRDYSDPAVPDLPTPNRRFPRAFPSPPEAAYPPARPLDPRRLHPLLRSSPPFRNPGPGRGKGTRPNPPPSPLRPLPTFRAISPLTSCMTARSVSCRSSITAPSNGCPTTSWTATRPKSTSRHSSAASARPWRHAG